MQLQETGGFRLIGVVARTQPGDVDAQWYPSLEACKADVDLLIDFTLPGGTRMAAEWCADNGVALLSGTTGLSPEDSEALTRAAAKVPVLWAPNLSYGVALMTALVRQAAATLGVSANVSIADIHHQHKIDTPSGTALALGVAVTEGLAQNRPADDAYKLAYSSVREGEVVGEHTVRFELPSEVIELRHQALDRAVFAKGALKAGAWLVEQPTGNYSTSEWLGLGP